MNRKYFILTFTLLALLVGFGRVNAQTQYKVLPTICAVDNDKRVKDDSTHALKGIVLDTNSKPIDQVYIYLSFTSTGNPDILWMGTNGFHTNEKGEFTIAVADSMKDKDMKLVFVASGYENQEINFSMDEMPCDLYVQMGKLKEMSRPEDNSVGDTFGFVFTDTADPDMQRDLDFTKSQMSFKAFKPIEDRIVDVPLPPPSFLGPTDKR